LQNGETVGTVTLTCSGGVATTAAGTYNSAIAPSAATGGTFSPANYTITYVSGTLTVYQAQLTVTGATQSMGYGQSVPTLTYTITGYLNSDPASVVSGVPALSTTATPSSATGNYPIYVALGTLSAANYSFGFVRGTMTVLSVVTIAATQPASEFGLVPGTFTVSRTDSAAAVTVNLQVSGGTAVPMDYSLPPQVIILAGQNSATVPLTPIQNFNTGASENSVILSLGTGSYVPGTTSSATEYIVDDYGNSNGDGLADPMAAEFGCTPQVSTTAWDKDTDGDGLPDSYQTLVGSADIPAPGLPSGYNTCPVQ
jgi:hypothetical protein